MNVVENKNQSEINDEEQVWTLDTDKYREEGAGPNAAKLTDLDFEYQAAAHAAGEEEPVYGVWGKIWKLYKRFAHKKGQTRVKKSAYLWLLVLTGWAGGHRYYERRWIVGLIYSALCWTGLPVAMCVIDAMAVIPIKRDEDGYIML